MSDARWTELEPGERIVIVCEECGSDQMQILAWIDPNEGVILDWCEGDGRGLCERCGEERYTKAIVRERGNENYNGGLIR